MSHWTHVDGVIEVSVPGRSQPEIQYIIDSVLEHLPIVPGSERDMTARALPCPGYNTSCSADEFGNRTNNLKDIYGYKCRRHGWMETQSNYQIVLDGALRDTYFESTKRYLTKWLCRLAKRLAVYKVLVRVSDGDKEFVFKDNRPFFDMWEEPSWGRNNKDDEPAWWEYLMWERHPRSEMPLTLIRKYYNDDETDKEFERRYNWRNEIEEGDKDK